MLKRECWFTRITVDARHCGGRCWWLTVVAGEAMGC